MQEHLPLLTWPVPLFLPPSHCQKSPNAALSVYCMHAKARASADLNAAPAAQLAARIATSNLHKSTLKSFTET